jgi:hypothetical protein
MTGGTALAGQRVHPASLVIRNGRVHVGIGQDDGEFL